jgi:hypothetical protein
MAHVTEWLEDRRVGANMQPFRVVVTDDFTGGLRDWTVDRDDNADQHTGLFYLYDDTGAAIIDGGTLETMTENGELVYYASLAEIDAAPAGRYTAVFVLLNAAGTFRDVLEYGQRIVERTGS